MLEKKNYLSKVKWEGTCLLNQTWGKETDTWLKVGIWKFADKIGWELILIILMLSLFQSSLTSSNVGNSLLRFISVFLLSSPTCWNFQISMTSLYPNNSSIQYMLEMQVSLLSIFFFLGSFVGFFWISNFVFMLYITTSSSVLLLFTSSFVRFYTSLHELMMNCFCGMVDRRKAFSLISSWDHCQRSSPSWISDTLRAGFEPGQNLSSGLVEWSCAVVITTTPRHHENMKSFCLIFLLFH